VDASSSELLASIILTKEQFRQSPSLTRAHVGVSHAALVHRRKSTLPRFEERTKDIIMRKNLSIALTLLSLIGIAPMLGACHTAAGAGEDLSAGGHAITNSAEKHTP
jgi:predicted small secreted protein